MLWAQRRNEWIQRLRPCSGLSAAALSQDAEAVERIQLDLEILSTLILILGAILLVVEVRKMFHSKTF